MSGTTKLMTPGGGGVNITPASSIASDVTVNVPSQNCTLGIQGPAFSAYSSNPTQTVASSTATKLTIDVVRFDTNSNFANSRFTPTVAGYYQINGTIVGDGTQTQGVQQIYIFKNGTNYVNGSAYMFASSGTGVGGPNMSASTLVYCNGTTDYIEIYAWQNSAGSKTMGCNDFSGVLVRSA